jgi:hypothetical protein
MPFLFWSFSMNQQQHIYFPITPQGGMWSSTTPSSCVSSSIWTTHQTTNGSTSRFHFKAFAPSYPFQHAIWQDIWGLLCSNFIMFWPKGGRLVYNSTNLPSLLIISLVFSTTLRTQLGLPHLSIVGIPWCVCTHPIDLMGIHFFTLCSWQRMHWNPWCNSQHLCCHYVRDVNFHVGWE